MNTVKSIKDVVASKISEAGTVVAEVVATELASTEIARRKDLIIQGIASSDKQRKELAKIKPDIKTVSVDADGKRTPLETWSPGALDSKDKATLKLEKLDKAINTALELNDADSYNKLSDALK